MKMGNYLSKWYNKLFKKEEDITYKVWRNIDSNDFIYPEDQYIKKNNIGICMSGGGMRACCFSYGILRSLHYLNLLDKMKYISANSGSTWILTPLSYMDQDISLNTFFDEYIKPEDLTLEKLKEINKESYLDILHNITIIDDFFENFIKNKLLNDEYNNKDFWTKSISEIYLKKYGLDDFNILPTIDNKKDDKYKYKKLRKDVPYPIINGSIFINESLDIGLIEFTPLYYGIPNKIKLNNNTFIGNNYIESIGCCSVNQNNINDIKKQIKNNNILDIQTKCPSNIISINKQMGISSSALSVPLEYYINNNLHDILDFSFFNYFDFNSHYFNNNMRLTDGGLYDNNGILALLRRNVKKIIFCNSSSNNSDIITTDVYKSIIGDIAGYFGVGNIDNTYYGQTCEDYNKYRKVFDNVKWITFNRLVKEKIDNKLPIVFEMELEVLENKYNGVKGGYIVKILFIIMDKCDWIDKLPETTKNLINSSKENFIENFIENTLELLQFESEDFDVFPHISTLKFNYSKELVVGLTQLSSYLVYNNKDLIEKFINN